MLREILVSGLREYLAGIRIGLPVTRLAKWKTGFQMGALGTLLAGDSGAAILHLSFLPVTLIGEVMLWVAAGLTLVTGWDYLTAGLRQQRSDRHGARRRRPTGPVSAPCRSLALSAGPAAARRRCSRGDAAPARARLDPVDRQARASRLRHGPAGQGHHRHREAGAHEVLVAPAKRWALLHEVDGPEPALPTLLARMAPVDLVLVEGFKTHEFPKLEVYRPALGKPPIWPDWPDVAAVATDADQVDCPRTILPLNDPGAIAHWI